jgi:hypothetical protein
VRTCTALILVAVLFAVGCEANSAPTQGTPVQLERVSFDLPTGWQQVPPSSSMRVAQASIPGPGGAAEMAVFHFGAGQGGDVEANLQRWINQVELEPGSAVQRESFESNGMRVTWVDVRGTLKPGQMGMGPSTPQPNSRLLGAVVEGDGGPWFFKATGTDATLAPQRDAFLAMLHTMKPRLR